MNKQRKPKKRRTVVKAIRRGKRGSKTKMDAVIRKAVAKELLAVCFSFLRQQGFASKELQGLATECLSRPSPLFASTLVMRDISRLGRLINEWTENPRYIDSGGRPSVLAIGGEPPNFEELARKHFSDRSVRNVLQFAIKFKAVERPNKRSVAHLGSCVLLTGNRTLLLSHTVRAIKGFLATSEHNGRKLQAAPWPERQAFTELPEEKFSEFLRFMREPIVNLVDMGNRWLMANTTIQDDRSPNQKKQRNVFTGVHAYVFRDT